MLLITESHYSATYSLFTRRSSSTALSTSISSNKWTTAANESSTGCSTAVAVVFIVAVDVAVLMYQ